MKKAFKLLSVSLVLLCCIVTSGCSCAKPMNITYKVTAMQGDKNELSSNVVVNVVLNKKFREPIDTPCYKKMKKGYVELDTIAMRYQCYDKDCYKKVDGKHTLMSKDTVEVSKCISGNIKCYEKVETTYYKLIEDPEGISECYTAEGEFFERATYGLAEKVELEKNTVISKNINRYNYLSEKQTVPSEKNYSLIYDFQIKNLESQQVLIEAIDFEEMTNGIIKQTSYSKIKMTTPLNRVFQNNKYYYVVNPGETITVSVEIKNLLTSDAKEKKVKDLELNIPIIVKA